MIALARNFRLVPIVVFATASLFVLKTLGILLDGGFALGPDRSVWKFNGSWHPLGGVALALSQGIGLQVVVEEVAQVGQGGGDVVADHGRLPAIQRDGMRYSP